MKTTETTGEYEAERLDTIRLEIEMIEGGLHPQLNPLNGADMLAYWREQERLGEQYLEECARLNDEEREANGGTHDNGHCYTTDAND